MEVQALGASAQAVRHHYDLSNQFYALWLDASRTYSCALWDSEEESLEQAQERKLQHHIDWAQARSAKRVLDVGCGWGGLLRKLVTEAGVDEAVGLTLSAAQAEYARSLRLKGVRVLEQSWADHETDAPYDAIISIGAFEHFAVPDLSDDQRVGAYRDFFRKCHRLLRPGGCVSLQTIAYGRASRKDLNGFILNEIFPESDLPTLLDIVRACAGVFEIVAHRNDRLDYARTFSEWAKRLASSRQSAVDLVGEAKVKAYETYHGLFQIGFHTGAMDLLRLKLRRIDSYSPDRTP